MIPKKFDLFMIEQSEKDNNNKSVIGYKTSLMRDGANERSGARARN